MPRDYIDIECTPCDEPCEQIGPSFRREFALAEASAMMAEIVAMHGPVPPGAAMFVKWHQHDFGSYPMIRMKFEDTDARALAWVYDVEANTPNEWSSVGKAHLLDRIPDYFTARSTH